MSEDTVTVVEIVETEYDEKAVIDSPYDARHFFNALPWKTLEEEIEEHGSFEAKLRGRDVPEPAIEGAIDYDFDDDFAAHATFDGDALDGEGAWKVDVPALEEVVGFLEYAGYEVENQTNVPA